MNQPSRRAVLRGAVLVATAAALPVGAAGSANGLVAAGLPVTRLLRRVFRPHVGSTFLLTAGKAEHLATLTAVSDPGRADEKRFSLLFTMADGARPADGIYAVSHPKLKAIDLYVGSIGHPDKGVYEAVINA